ncbi:competence/damage-inducible protein CinA [Desulfofarcimen acetoxidans DSM 771]|jgi:nicotinamide-nucleotide amidase|uniref:Putative competence-damage inducible protein n=1 Tax=Desulfofarcimen acetoxidans (strain ATCC 49208 / DSM 771 / KCTC 5769 / VKM B-1644 / 5575) TaxID=485916 RepID=C8W3S1_DESAS|nr:competence/damage-inducible protein A [Desulfofarcimen acetoxidans]ACV63857.1 competence/damage-inducible protein CinA [Desulfofarcimen acetoxidans DSM 771]
MRAEIIFTGTELLNGQVLNTHGRYLGEKLSKMGVETLLHIAVGDSRERMTEVFCSALLRSDLIIITGGLGPTTDDLTKEVVAEVLGLSMVLDEAVLEKVRSYFITRGRSIPECIRKEAFFPEGARLFDNPVGSAPGILIERNTKKIICLPGPPKELIPTFEGFVPAYLVKSLGQGEVTLTALFRLTGLTEPDVQDILSDLCLAENPGIAFLAMPGEVQVRISARAAEPEAKRLVAELAEKVEARLGGYIFARDEDVPEELVGSLLLGRGLTIGLAESCTGGLIAGRLTAVPGSSHYLLGGVVAYSNMVKEKVLGVPAQILERYGAVSKQTALLMAKGARDLIGSDLGLSVTGIAGPDGGSDEKPVGLVYIALADRTDAWCGKFNFAGRRESIRRGVSNMALNMVKLYLSDKENMSTLKRS